jgi:hypothetical protein
MRKEKTTLILVAIPGNSTGPFKRDDQQIDSLRAFCLLLHSYQPPSPVEVWHMWPDPGSSGRKLLSFRGRRFICTVFLPRQIARLSFPGR